jgi:hypothetical protein
LNSFVVSEQTELVLNLIFISLSQDNVKIGASVDSSQEANTKDVLSKKSDAIINRYFFIFLLFFYFKYSKKNFSKNKKNFLHKIKKIF